MHRWEPSDPLQQPVGLESAGKPSRRARHLAARPHPELRGIYRSGPGRRRTALAHTINGEAPRGRGGGPPNTERGSFKSPQIMSLMAGVFPLHRGSAPSPVNAYGASKLAESAQYCRSSGSPRPPRGLALPSPGSQLFRTMLRLAETRDHLTIVSDQRGALPHAMPWPPPSSHSPNRLWGAATRRGDLSCTAPGRDRLGRLRASDFSNGGKPRASVDRSLWRIFSPKTTQPL